MAALAQRTAQLLAFPGFSLRAALTEALKRHRLPERLIDAYLREAAGLRPCGIDETLTQVLAARMRVEPLDLSRLERLFLIGPSGAGVGSAAAKIRHQAARAGHQIRIDAHGFNPRNLKARMAFGCIGARQDQPVIGVVSALADAEEVSEIIAAFGLSRLIVTGLDMTTRFGTLAAAATEGASLAHVTRSAKADAPLETLGPRDLAELLLN
jgi:hypothetical protein